MVKQARLSGIQGKDRLVFLPSTHSQMISNDQLKLLSKIRTPKLREWGTNCLGQILYFLFYPSSGTAGSMPQPFSTRVRCHSPPRRFNMMTHSEGLPQVPLQQPKRLGFYVHYGPSHGRPTVRMDHYKSFTLQVSPTHGSAHSTDHSTSRAPVILRVGSHLTARVTLYRSSRLMG